jgi:signal transduction histidine kinase
MNVPTTEEIANNRVSPLIVNVAGGPELLLAALQTDQEKERARILKGIHDEISPQLLSAVFLTQILKEKLEAKELEESVMAAELSEALIKVIDGLVEVLDPSCQTPPSA